MGRPVEQVGETLQKRHVLKHEPERPAFRISKGLRRAAVSTSRRGNHRALFDKCRTAAAFPTRHGLASGGARQTAPHPPSPSDTPLLLLSHPVGRGAPAQQAKHKKMAVTHASQFRRFHSLRPRKSAASRASPRASEHPVEPRSR